MKLSKKLIDALKNEGVQFSEKFVDLVESLQNWLFLVKVEENAKKDTGVKLETEADEKQEETKKTINHHEIAEKQLKRLKFLIEFVLENYDNDFLVSQILDLVSSILVLTKDVNEISSSFSSDCFPSSVSFSKFFSSFSPYVSCASCEDIISSPDFSVDSSRYFSAPADCSVPKFCFSMTPLVKSLQLENFFVALATVAKPKEAYVSFISCITSEIPIYLKLLVLRSLAISLEKIKSKRVCFLVQVLPVVLQKFVKSRNLEYEFNEEGHDYDNDEKKEGEQWKEQLPEEDVYIGLEKHETRTTGPDENSNKTRCKLKKRNKHEISNLDCLAAVCNLYDWLCKGCANTQEDDNYSISPIALASFGLSVIFHYTVLMIDRNALLDTEKKINLLDSVKKSKSEKGVGRESSEDIKSAKEHEKEKTAVENADKGNQVAETLCGKTGAENVSSVLVNMWFENTEKGKRERKEDLTLKHLKSIFWRVCVTHPDICGLLDNINIINPVDELGGGGDLEIPPLFVAVAAYVYLVKCIHPASLPLVYSAYRYVNILMRASYVFVIACKHTSSIITFYMRRKQITNNLNHLLRTSFLIKMRNLIFTAAMFLDVVQKQTPAVYHSIHSFNWNPATFFSLFLDTLASSPELSSHQRNILYMIFKYICRFFNAKTRFELYLQTLQKCESDTACGSVLILFKEEWCRETSDTLQKNECCVHTAENEKDLVECNNNECSAKVKIISNDDENLRWLGDVLIKVLLFCLSGKTKVEISMDLLTCSLNWLKYVLLCSRLSYFHSLLLSKNNFNINLPSLIDGLAKQVDIELALLKEKIKNLNPSNIIVGSQINPNSIQEIDLQNFIDEQVTAGEIKRVDCKYSQKGYEVKLNRIYLVSDILSNIRTILLEKFHS